MKRNTVFMLIFFLVLTGCAAHEEPVTQRAPKHLITIDDYEDLEVKPPQKKPIKVDYKEGITVQSIKVIDKLTPEQENQRKFIKNAPYSTLADLKIRHEKGAKINVRDEDNETVLINLMKGDFDNETFLKLEYLLSVGAKVNFRGRSKTNNLSTPLDAAVYYSSSVFKEDTVSAAPFYAEKVIKHLIESGAFVSGADDAGRTPLHTAAREGNAVAARILLAAGAEVTAKDYEGKTPLDYAASEEVIQLLQESGASETPGSEPKE